MPSEEGYHSTICFHIVKTNPANSKMYVEIMNNTSNSSIEKESNKFTIKRMLKAIFKKKIEIIKSIDDNTQVAKNTANSKMYEIEYPEEEKDLANLIPVNYISTEHGTFFWTVENPIEPDADLIQPLYCCTSSQLALCQY